MIRPDVLHADNPRLRTAELPPRRPPHERLPDAVDPPVQVVRREECEIPADVAIPLDHVVPVTSHVFLVARKDDEIVVPCELVAARDRAEVVVREEVDRPAGLVQPRDELEIPVVEAKRHPEVEIRARQVDVALAAADVPGVAPAVAVRVGEVVRLPRLRREHDGNPLRAQPPGPHDERRVADAPVGGSRPHEVETTRPVARPHDPQNGRPVTVAGPVDPDRTGLREPARANVLLARPARRLVREYLQVQGSGVRRQQ